MMNRIASIHSEAHSDFLPNQSFYFVAVTRLRQNAALPAFLHNSFDDISEREHPFESNEKPSFHMSNIEKSTPHNTTEINSTYAVLDFETTGLNPKHGDRAIEIGISLYSRGKEIDTFSSLINPGRRIDPFITSLTGISNSMVATAPSAREVMQLALEFTKDAQLVAHNAGFDRKFWRHEIQYELGISDDRDFLCTLMLSRRIFQTFSSHKLGRIAQELGVRASRSHRALSDAQVTSQVLSVMFERLRLAYPDKNIDPQFLKTYQKRARTGLPDLTIERLIVPEVMHPTVRPRVITTI
ncbi:MAG: DNA polymerase-3 subunit epsilon [Granulosicoccus sp.]|jgi:DNA polymerase-3 subunit epsilon